MTVPLYIYIYSGHQFRLGHALLAPTDHLQLLAEPHMA